MKFVHTADWHVGGSRFIPNFLERQEAMIDSIFQLALSRNIEVVVMAGDVFDVSEPTREEENLLQRKILQYDAAGFHILMIPGNHDLVDATGRTAVRSLAALSDHGRLHYSVITEHTRYVTVGDIVFCLLCHRRKKFSQDSKYAINSYFDSSIAVDKKLVVVAHETISGSMSDVKLADGSNYVVTSGEEAPDSDLPVTYWALGDLHKNQKVSSRAFYSGAPLQLKFGDEWPKGVLIADTDDPEHPEFVSITSNQLVRAKEGDSIPSGSWVKWVLDSASDMLSMTKSSNVVKVEFVSEDKGPLVLSSEISLRDKILKGVIHLGATDDELSVAKSEVDSLLTGLDL